MPLDLAMLATTVVTSFLLPYVKKGAEKIAESVTENVSQSAAEYVTDLAKNVWNRVTTVFSSDKDKQLLEQFQEYPDQAASLVEAVLKKKLEQDELLAQDLDNLVNTPGPDGQHTGAQIMHTGIAGILDMRSANLSHASGMNLAGVMMGKPPSSSPSSPTSELPEKHS